MHQLFSTSGSDHKVLVKDSFLASFCSNYEFYSASVVWSVTANKCVLLRHQKYVKRQKLHLEKKHHSNFASFLENVIKNTQIISNKNELNNQLKSVEYAEMILHSSKITNLEKTCQL